MFVSLLACSYVALLVLSLALDNVSRARQVCPSVAGHNLMA